MVASDVGHAQLQRPARSVKQSARAGSIAWTPACGSGTNRNFRSHVSANGGSSGFLDSTAKACGILEADDAVGVATSGNYALALEARLSPAGPEGHALVVLSYARVDTGVMQLLALQIDSDWTSASLLVLHCRTQRSSSSSTALHTPLERSSSSSSASSATTAIAQGGGGSVAGSSTAAAAHGPAASVALSVVARLSSARLQAPPGRDPDDFHTLELHCRRGNTLSLWSDGRVVFASVDVRRALGLAQQRTAGPAAAGLRAAAASPLTGPLCLGVAAARLDFRAWRVTSLAAAGAGGGGAGAARGMRAALAAAEAGDVERASAWGDEGESWEADRGYGEEGQEEQEEHQRTMGWGQQDGVSAGRWDAGDGDGRGRGRGRGRGYSSSRSDRYGHGGDGGSQWVREEEEEEAGRGRSRYGPEEEEDDDGGGGRDVWGPPAAARRAARSLNAPPHTALAAAASAITTKWSRRPYIADLDPQLVDAVMREIVQPPPPPRSGNGTRGGGGGGGVRLSDVLVREDAKQLLSESVVMPLILPELFAGALEPWRGVLLFGPPGTGKTMLARAVAATAGITFFAVGAAALTSKWRGDSEKMVRTLFAVAEACAPSVVFVDEVDALVGGGGGAGAMEGGGGGGDGDSEASRRFKSELLQQMDGLTSRSGAGRPGARATAAAGVLVLAASNSPWDIDPALRRRLEKRIYIGLPEREARRAMLDAYLPEQGCRLAPDVDLDQLADRLEGYSGADVKLLCRDALMAPLRRLTGGHTPAHYRRLRKALGLEGGGAADGAGSGRGGGGAGGRVGPVLEVTRADVEGALRRIRPSVGREQVTRYEEWDRLFAAV
ncbi:hypothetical protein HYH02_015196 [Chlamydomonas schloesseri]|uniref:AAA+ ATPase domain-containing protein n=1 Tax=Chlamydomonas schloesseri TaxID=2026947 RepID=A0A835SEY6_9CHLO|nr:hypothetical protein HYH02_015196 [Chlamydomonas schloesseri]|eukprot:KAG2424306.1 hypothetical protein HYH02_015196 [Chlamydomonas schloesseri]